MNRRMVIFTVGQMLKVESLILVLPLFVSMIYKEQSFFAYFLTIAIALASGFIMTLIARPRNHVIYAKEGFVIVSLAWVFMSLIGALPFVISGEIPNYIDAVFETVSGFTTTGASILNDVESLSKSNLFWRSFTHWVGGMGVLVFVMAIIPKFSDRSIHLLRAEVPGPIVGKLVPKIKDTAKILYLIYIALTAIEIVFLLCGGMSLFDSVVHSFGTAGTGGFGIKADSIGGYNHYIQWVIAIFMLLFGINFNLFYLALLKKFRAVFKSTEIWVYFGIVAASVMIIAYNIYPIYKNIADCLRLSTFQVSSIITTTGYSTADFDAWPVLSKTILLMLMFIGGCAGSTAGGIKVSRVILLIKMIKQELRHLLHPNSVSAVKYEGKTVENATQKSVSAYLAMYVCVFVTIIFIISFDKFDVVTNISAAAACFNNIGPGFEAVGPMCSFAGYSYLSKIALSIAMLLGRLEIYPLFIAFSASTWTKE